jgi:hypothetical protein
MSTAPDLPRPLSRHQYGTLKFIMHQKVTLADLRHAHATTLGSLAYRGYLKLTGTGEEQEVGLTKTGEEALRVYTEAALNERSHEGELTERCLRLLRHGRRRVTPIKVA